MAPISWCHFSIKDAKTWKSKNRIFWNEKLCIVVKLQIHCLKMKKVKWSPSFCCHIIMPTKWDYLSVGLGSTPQWRQLVCLLASCQLGFLSFISTVCFVCPEAPLTNGQLSKHRYYKGFHTSVERNSHLLYFCFTSLFVWLKNLVPLF